MQSFHFYRKISVVCDPPRGTADVAQIWVSTVTPRIINHTRDRSSPLNTSVSFFHLLVSFCLTWGDFARRRTNCLQHILLVCSRSFASVVFLRPDCRFHTRVRSAGWMTRFFFKAKGCWILLYTNTIYRSTLYLFEYLFSKTNKIFDSQASVYKVETLF